MQIIHIGLIPDDERQDGDGKCQITVKYPNGEEQTPYAKELPGNDAADDCFLATLVETDEPVPEGTILPSLGDARVMVRFHHHSGKVLQVTFHPRR